MLQLLLRNTDSFFQYEVVSTVVVCTHFFKMDSSEYETDRENNTSKSSRSQKKIIRAQILLKKMGILKMKSKLLRR